MSHTSRVAWAEPCSSPWRAGLDWVRSRLPLMLRASPCRTPGTTENSSQSPGPRGSPHSCGHDKGCDKLSEPWGSWASPAGVGLTDQGRTQVSLEPLALHDLQHSVQNVGAVLGPQPRPGPFPEAQSLRRPGPLLRAGQHSSGRCELLTLPGAAPARGPGLGLSLPPVSSEHRDHSETRRSWGPCR